MPTNLDQQVYLDDINEQEEMALDCWKVMYNYYQRAKYQGAPEELLNKLSQITNNFATAHEGLKEIRGCFPPIDGKPVD